MKNNTTNYNKDNKRQTSDKAGSHISQPPKRQRVMNSNHVNHNDTNVSAMQNNHPTNYNPDVQGFQNPYANTYMNYYNPYYGNQMYQGQYAYAQTQYDPYFQYGNYAVPNDYYGTGFHNNAQYTNVQMHHDAIHGHYFPHQNEQNAPFGYIEHNEKKVDEKHQAITPIVIQNKSDVVAESGALSVNQAPHDSQESIENMIKPNEIVNNNLANENIVEKQLNLSHSEIVAISTVLDSYVDEDLMTGVCNAVTIHNPTKLGDDAVVGDHGSSIDEPKKEPAKEAAKENDQDDDTNKYSLQKISNVDSNNIDFAEDLPHIHKDDDMQVDLPDNLSNDDEIVQGAKISDIMQGMVVEKQLGSASHIIDVDELPDKIEYPIIFKKPASTISIRGMIGHNKKKNANQSTENSRDTRERVFGSESAKGNEYKMIYKDLPTVDIFTPRIDAEEAKLAHEKWIEKDRLPTDNHGHVIVDNTFTDDVLDVDQLLTNQSYLDSVLNYLCHRLEYENARNKQTYKHNVETAFNNRFVLLRNTFPLIYKYMHVLYTPWKNHTLNDTPYYSIPDANYALHARECYKDASHFIYVNERWGKGDVIAFMSDYWSGYFRKCGKDVNDYSNYIKLKDSHDPALDRFDLKYSEANESVLIIPITCIQPSLMHRCTKSLHYHLTNKEEIDEFLSNISISNKIIMNQKPCTEKTFLDKMWYDIVKIQINHQITKKTPITKEDIYSLKCFIAIHIPSVPTVKEHRKVSDPELYLIAHIAESYSQAHWGAYCIINLKRVMNRLLPIGNPLVYNKEKTRNLWILVEDASVERSTPNIMKVRLNDCL